MAQDIITPVCDYDWCDYCDDHVAYKAYPWHDYCAPFCEQCAYELGAVEADHDLSVNCKKESSDGRGCGGACESVVESKATD